MAEQLTDLEQLMLLAILQVEEEAYAAAIQEVLEDRAERGASLGTIYNTLLRLEEHGHVSSEMGEPSAVRGGKAKRLYQVTPEGHEALRRARAIFDRMWEAVPEGSA